MKQFGSTCNYVLCAYADQWCSGVGLVIGSTEIFASNKITDTNRSEEATVRVH